MNMTDSTQSSGLLIRVWRWCLGLCGLVVVGALGSGFWEVAVKPGLSVGGRFALNLLSLGSETIRDYAYRNAALDPTPVAALQMLFLGAGCLVSFNFASALRLWLRMRARGEEPSARATRRESLLPKMKRFLLVSGALSIITGIVLIVGLVVQSQAVLIWRVFHTNLAILAPYLSEDDEERMNARFRSIATRAEYVEIDEQMREVADANGRRLASEEVW
jgi:hypothetical protein